MPGLSEEDARSVLKEVTELRQALDASLPLLDPDTSRYLEGVRDGFAAVGTRLQTLIGPEDRDRGPAEVRPFIRREKGRHRS